MTKEQLLNELKAMEQRLSHLEASEGQSRNTLDDVGIRNEEALIQAETKFRTLVDQSLVGIYIMQNRHFSYVNPKAAEILGYTADEIISSVILDDIVFEEDKELVNEHIRELTQGMAKTVNLPCRAIKKDGTIIHIEVQGSIAEFNERPFIIGTILDITDRKKMEAELIKAQEFKSLSVFASGVAHEYNNLLTAIIGNLSLAKMYAKPGYEVYDVLIEAEKASIRAKELTLQLLTFADGSRAAKKVIYLKNHLKDWFSNALSNSQVKPDFFIQEDLLPVEADMLQLHQVIDSIVTYVLKSMSGGEVIKLKAENIDIDYPSELPLEKGEYVLISIEDHGIGLPENVLENIFDPLYTTREQSNGLGLASSYSIIKKHNGHITVDSKQGAGTIFNIYLPAFLRKVDTSDEIRGEYSSNKGRILIMDDEEIVRLVVSKLLSQCGYESELARNGEEMLSMYKTALGSKHPFDAVIMDLVIEEGMGGQEAIKYLMELDPNVKAIVSSGYSNAPAMSHAKEFGFLGFLAKPFRLEDLANVLHEVLAVNKV